MSVTPAGVDETPALFVPHGDGFLPTAYSRGPWSPDALHGGPVAALVTRAFQSVDAPVQTRLTRVTLELLRPVPLAPLTVSVEVIRPGKLVSTLDAHVRRADDDTLVATARAQRIRVESVDLPDGVVDDVPDLPPAETPMPHWPGAADIAFHSSAIEHRFLRGGFGQAGPAFDWIRFVVPVVPGEEPTGWQRAAATADFTNGLSAVVGFDTPAMFINPDLTIHLWREPVGEWIGSDAVTRTSASGIGTSDGALWDRSGRVGRCNQSLLLRRGL